MRLNWSNLTKSRLIQPKFRHSKLLKLRSRLGRRPPRPRKKLIKPTWIDSRLKVVKSEVLILLSFNFKISITIK